MNETTCAMLAEQMILDTRNQFNDLPEPEQTYAVELFLCKKIIRLKEEVSEVRWGGGE